MWIGYAWKLVIPESLSSFALGIGIAIGFYWKGLDSDSDPDYCFELRTFSPP